ncbi:MAG: C39 family peptidase [Cyclobacteriaceae bacterium]|nr:C39 family peptidase [Cyclobacteriaceae bacterium]
MEHFVADGKRINILAQPTDESCGPTCLQALYDFYDDHQELHDVIRQVKQVKGGGTLAVMLGNHALKRGYSATIYTYNLQVFDPTWFQSQTDLISKLKEQLSFKHTKKFKQATKAYTQFLSSGGEIVLEELRPGLLKKILSKNTPILTGLSATYLYQSAREIPKTNTYHDTKGEPVGHFVVIRGYDEKERKVLIADPLNPNPIKETIQYYSVDIQRVINAILLGIVTYDANLLIIQPK